MLPNIFFNMPHLVMRFGLSGSSFNSSDRHANQNQNELADFPRETRESEKAIQNLPTNLLAVLVPGVVLIERILYCTSYACRCRVAAALLVLCEVAGAAARNCRGRWVGAPCEERTRGLFVHGPQGGAGGAVRMTCGDQWWTHNDMARGRPRKCLGTLFCPAQNVQEQVSS